MPKKKKRTDESSSADYFDDDGAAASAEDDDEGGLMETERMRATDQERLLRQRQRQHQEGHEDGERQRGYEREDECGVLKAGCGGYRPFEDVDEGAMDYDREYSEDIFLGRANRVRLFSRPTIFLKGETNEKKRPVCLVGKKNPEPTHKNTKTLFSHFVLCAYCGQEELQAGSHPE